MKKVTKALAAIMLMMVVVCATSCKKTDDPSNGGNNNGGNGGGGNQNVHEYVDLGLPSGTLWATCNVGATTPEGYGDYYAWGETQSKDVYDWSTYKYSNGGDGWNTLTKYCNQTSYGYNGFTDDLAVLQLNDDAATVNWGNDWRTPTYSEWEELDANCTQTWTTRNGVYGSLFIASNGNRLFLPAAGSCETAFYHDGSEGRYWSNSHRMDYPRCAFHFIVFSGNCGMLGSDRCIGLPVRAVRSARQN